MVLKSQGQRRSPGGTERVFGSGRGHLNQTPREHRWRDKEASTGSPREGWRKLSTGRTLTAKRLLVGMGAECAQDRRSLWQVEDINPAP